MAMVDYMSLTVDDIRGLSRDKTVFLMTVSPLEAHGFHLPVGTDVMIAEEVGKRSMQVLSERMPELTLVNLPPCALGSDPVPYMGSIPISPKTLEGVVFDVCTALRNQGFSYLVIFDNHGGPRHQLALYEAQLRAWKKGFALVIPFLYIFKRMVRDDPDLLRETGLTGGTCGDDFDSHAGTNETSLMMALGMTGRVEVDRSPLPRHSGGAKSVLRAAQILRRLGAEELSQDLEHLANTLAWVGSPSFRPYLGNPTDASADAGEAMLNYHVKVSCMLTERALRRENFIERPILGGLKFLRRLPV